MRRLLNRLLRCQAGNFALISGLSLAPIAGMAGLAVDFSQAYSARTTLQGEVDVIATSVAAEGPDAKPSRFYEPMRQAAIGRMDLGDNVRVEGRWISVNDYEVVASAEIPRTLSRLIPVGESNVSVSSRAVARYMGVKLAYKTPARAMLDAEAGDYNRVYAYCFDAEMGKNDKALGRSQRTAIADNVDSSRYKDPIPQCGAGEVLSFELYNVRNSRGAPWNWDNPKATNYSYHTDTVRSAQGVESYDLGGWAILETVMCPSLDLCKNKNLGGIIPHGKDRVPQRTTQACEPGKFMYFGWEDRPPGRGTSDRDYDDIRVIIECPEVVSTGTEAVRLVH